MGEDMNLPFAAQKPVIKAKAVTSPSVARNNAAALHHAHTPLGERLRPQSLHELVGQDELLKPDALLCKFLDSGQLPSLILWGPPGSGKTTLALLIAKELAVHNIYTEKVSAVFSSVGELRKLFTAAQTRLQTAATHTLLFVDEIHRFNKAQQESFLPYVESGLITLIGATTENPSFSLIGALLSRTQVLVLQKLSPQALDEILVRAEALLEQSLPLNAAARQELIRLADGDGRYLLTLVQNLMTCKLSQTLDKQALLKLLSERKMLYDKSGEEHYNLISALHKTLRGSDCDAALYYLARMLNSGEDARYIFRRLLRFAYEDIGLADPQAAVYTLSGWQTFERLGSPEGELALTQTVIYLANAPKSNSAYTAEQTSHAYARAHGTHAPPKHILNAPTQLMKQLDYGRGYQYDHDSPAGFSGQNYFPEALKRESFYHPTARGFEREMQKRLKYFNKLRAARTAQTPPQT